MTKKELKKGQMVEVIEERADITPFLQGLEDKGDLIECVFIGMREIDFKGTQGVKKVPVVLVDDTEYLLPTNYQLIQKLTKVADLKQGEKCNISVEITGFTKLEGGKKVKNFKVMHD